MPERRFANQEQEYTPEQMGRIRYLVNLFERGLDSKDIIAHHGTSLEVLQDLINTGRLKGSKKINPKIGISLNTISA